MSPASYRTAPPRVARTTLPAGERGDKSGRRDLHPTAPIRFSYLLAEGDGVAEGEALAPGAGVALAPGAGVTILASASRARCRAAESFFCWSPYAAKSPLASASCPALMAPVASSRAAFRSALALELPVAGGAVPVVGVDGVWPLLAAS